MQQVDSVSFARVLAGREMLALTTLYLPGMPAALLWPHEWIIILAWTIAGGLMYSSVRNSYGPADPARILRRI